MVKRPDSIVSEFCSRDRNGLGTERRPNNSTRIQARAAPPDRGVNQSAVRIVGEEAMDP